MSTNIPNPITRPNKTIVFIVYPNAERIINDINIDIGIAKPTNKAFLNPRKNIKTVTTSKIPKMMLFTNSLTWFNVILDWSFEIVITRSFGNPIS